MIRFWLTLLILMALALGGVAIATGGDLGTAVLTWSPWQASASAATAILLIPLGGLLITLIGRGITWTATAPGRFTRSRVANRRREAEELLTQGFLSLAAGDGKAAARYARRAAETSPDDPSPLARLLTAQAAEADGDPATARATYTAMLADPDLKPAAEAALARLAPKGPAPLSITPPPVP